MINQDALALLIRSEARKTRGTTLEIVGAALMILALGLMVTFGFGTWDVQYDSWEGMLFWVSLLFIGPAGTAMLFLGYTEVADAQKAIDRALEVMRQSKYQ
jgi:hypothetical protein